MEKQKQGIRVVDTKMYQTDMERYELHKNDPNAPLCPYGNQSVFIRYDKHENNYVRFTKSVLLKLLKENNKI